MNRSNKTFIIAISGLFVAIGIALVYGGSVIPNLALTFYGVAGFLVGIVILEKDIKSGIILYLATVILSVLLVPNKIALIPYITVFGIYGFIKLIIEKIKNAWMQITLKGVFFAIVGYFSLFIYKELFFSSIRLPNFSNYILFVGSIIIGVVYDYIYTLAIYFYRNRIKREKVNFKLLGDKDGDEKR